MSYWIKLCCISPSPDEADFFLPLFSAITFNVHYDPLYFSPFKYVSKDLFISQTGSHKGLCTKIKINRTLSNKVDNIHNIKG